MKSEINLESDGGALKDLVVSGLKLDEGLSRTYRGELTVFSPNPRSPKKLRDEALGRHVTVKIVQDIENEGTVTRYLNGVITAVAHLGTKIVNEEIASFCGTEKRRLSAFRLVVEPQLASLAFTRRTLDYPDTTPLGVVKAVLKRNRIDFTAEGQYLASEEYSGKIRFVQRDETDLAFIERVMSRYGISYAFTHVAKGSERVILSDGGDYPALSPLEFSGLDSYSDAQELAFSTEKTEGMFRLTDFTAESRLGFTGLKDGIIRPAQTKAAEQEAGDTGTSHVWLRNELPAGYGEDADESTVDKDLERFTKATQAALRLSGDNWRGSTPHIAAMPGRILKIAGFVDATDGEDEPVKARVTSASLSADLLAKNDDVFRVAFSAMDFADDLSDKRWVPTQTNTSASDKREVISDKRSGVSLLEAVVCDRNGKFDDSQTINTIVTSSHATAEMPWVFLVKNPNPGAEEDVNKVIDVAMTQPLGGKRAGLYRFPRVGERVFVMLTGDRAVLMGYVPDRTGSFSDFPEAGDKWSRQSTALRFTAPTEEQKANGAYSEIGFSYAKSAAEALEQRIIDGTAIDYLMSVAIDANDIALYNGVQNDDAGRIISTRQQYFSSPSSDSSKALSDLASDLASKYHLESQNGTFGTMLRIHSTGGITTTANGDIEISTPGSLRIKAWDVTINGTGAVHLQSDGKVQAAVGTASATVSGNGVVARAAKILDAQSEYDSALVVDAQDGVSATGANVRLNGLFMSQMADSMGGEVVATNGELRISGAAVDLATAKRENVTKSFENLPESSGLNRIQQVLDAWQAGSTPSGGPRPIVDRGVSAIARNLTSTKVGLLPTGNFRGTLSGATIAAENLSSTDGQSGTEADSTLGTLKGVPGGDPNLTITRRELVRAKAFIQQMDTHRQTVETVANSVVDGKSSSVTIHGHSLDLNVQNLNDLSEQHNADGAAGSGAE